MPPAPPADWPSWIIGSVRDLARSPAIWFVVPAAVLLSVANAFHLIHPLAHLVAAATVAAYVVAYASSIAVATLRGDAEPYEWDVAEDISSVFFAPIARATSLVGACALAFYAAHRFVPRLEVPVLVGMLVWAPMAWLRATFMDRLLTVMSIHVWRAIIRTIVPYALILVSCGGLLLLPVAAMWQGQHALSIALAPLQAIAILMGSRLLARLYVANAERIDWFSESARYYTMVR